MQLKEENHRSFFCQFTQQLAAFSNRFKSNIYMNSSEASGFRSQRRIDIRKQNQAYFLHHKIDICLKMF